MVLLTVYISKIIAREKYVRQGQTQAFFAIMLPGFGVFSYAFLRGIIAWHICQSNTNEVDLIRRITLQILTCMLLLMCLVLPAKAADSNSQAGKVAISAGRLNVRSGPTSNSSVLTALRKDSYVTLISKSGSWWKVEYGEDKYGYCHADYISVISGSAVSVNTKSGNLNVRTGAGAGYAKAGTVSKGETVIHLSESGSWSRILYDGTKTGYVSSQYLSQNDPSVTLWVKNMKQMDERWADTVIGTSGKTIAQIGCATTAIAMVESHRTGIIRYPDEMMTLLEYTPSGSVYWPSHYTTVTDGSGYLSRIYSLLKQGKPILFGATNQYGSQHWVVITGFTGGSITAEKFTIQDPGSNSRTNLQQFLNVYPNFYKFFYY